VKDPFDIDDREDGCDDDLPTRDDLNYLAEQAAMFPTLPEESE
jgi:hypothetical protein